MCNVSVTFRLASITFEVNMILIFLNSFMIPSVEGSAKLLFSTNLSLNWCNYTCTSNYWY